MIIVCFLSGSFFIAKKTDGGSASMWLIALFAAVILSVEVPAAFGVFGRMSLLITGLVFVGIMLTMERHVVRRWIAHPPRSLRDSFPSLFTIEPAEIRRALPLGALFFVIALFAALCPIAELDSVSYHLPIASQLVATGSAWDVFQAGYVGPNTYFPANHEAMLAFLIAVFQTTQMSFIVTMLGVLLFYHALRSLAGDGRSSSAVFPALLLGLSFPFLFRQFLSLQIDLFLFSLLGSATAFLVAGIVHRRPVDAMKFFLTLGLALGTKYNALSHAVLLLPLVAWLFVRLRLPLKKWLPLPLLTMVTGGFWYVRNWILVGNPIYPFGIDLLGWEAHWKIMAEMAQTSLWDTVLSRGLKETFLPVLDNPHFDSHLGTVALAVIPVTAALGIVMLILSVYRFFTSKSGSRQDLFHASVFAALVYLLFTTAAVYATSPYTFSLWNEVVRYSAGFIAVIPILLLFTSIASPSMRWVVNLCALSVAGYNIIVKSFLFSPDVHDFLREKSTATSEIGWALILGSIVLILLAGVMCRRNSHLAVNAFRIVLLSVALFLFARSLPPPHPADDGFLLRELSGYDRLLPAIALLRQVPKTDDRPAIAVTGLTHYWIFEKEGFNPMYLNVDGCDQCTYPDYRGEEESVRARPDEHGWKELVSKRHIDYLLIGTGGGQTSAVLPEKTWADADPVLFHPMLSRQGISLYAVESL
ncbi:MAG: hypothetical protein PHZ00_04700 [Candidatus Peribacteraceae bacterium]|nr:hypothetical protein [Candidatus Peribacteraceae bacterium]